MSKKTLPQSLILVHATESSLTGYVWVGVLTVLTVKLVRFTGMTNQQLLSMYQVIYQTYKRTNKISDNCPSSMTPHNGNDNGSDGGNSSILTTTLIHGFH